MRVLMILVGEAQPNALPVVHFERFLEPYYLFLDAGFEVVIASPQGGEPPTATLEGQRHDASRVMTRLRQDQPSRDALADTVELAHVVPSDFDGAFCLGVTGRVWPPHGDDPAAALIGDLLAAGKPVAVVPVQLDLEPHGTAEGILIGGDRSSAPVRIARALIGAMNAYPKI